MELAIYPFFRPTRFSQLIKKNKHIPGNATWDVHPRNFAVTPKPSRGPYLPRNLISRYTVSPKQPIVYPFALNRRLTPGRLTIAEWRFVICLPSFPSTWAEWCICGPWQRWDCDVFDTECRELIFQPHTLGLWVHTTKPACFSPRSAVSRPAITCFSDVTGLLQSPSLYSSASFSFLEELQRREV